MRQIYYYHSYFTDEEAEAPRGSLLGSVGAGIQTTAVWLELGMPLNTWKVEGWGGPQATVLGGLYVVGIAGLTRSFTRTSARAPLPGLWLLTLWPSSSEE